MRSRSDDEGFCADCSYAAALYDDATGMRLAEEISEDGRRPAVGGAEFLSAFYGRAGQFVAAKRMFRESRGVIC